MTDRLVENRIQVHQCLFGYADGHRLIASSKRLSQEAGGQLLLQSDRVHGLPSSTFEPYWTAFPVSSIKSYALMRTWPAEEMPRPGCVWTHALLISFSDLSRIEDLSSLRRYFRRPELSAATGYGVPVSVDVGVVRADSPVGVGINREAACNLVRNLYGQPEPVVLPLESLDPDLDATIFEIWSQQWARLQRSFSFRTAAGTADTPPTPPRFDLRFYRATGRLGSSKPLASWEAIVVADLIQPSPFRRFLKLYGQGQLKGRERLRVLAEVYSMTKGGGHIAAADLLLMLSEAMPAPEDGATLKSDIVNGAGTEPGIPTISDLDVLEFFASGRGRDALPLPGSDRIGAVAQLTKSYPERTLQLVEDTINQAFPEADLLVDQVRTGLDSSGLLARLDSYPQLRRRLVAKELDLLDDPHLLKITASERDALLAMVSEDALAAPLIGRLIQTDDATAAALFMARFPQAVDQAVLSRMAASFAGRGPAVPNAWQSAVDSISEPDFVQRNVSKITSYSELGVLLAKASPRTFLGSQSGPNLWVQALARSAVDVPDRQQTWILANILALALSAPRHGLERGFEIAFERVHSDILTGQLSGDALNFLTRQFPQVHWWQEWDSGYRLRLAVVNAYVRHDLDPKSFVRLTRDQDLLNSLVGIAEESKEGRSFLKRLAA